MGPLLEELEEIVQAACADGTNDLVLTLMIEVTMRSISSQRPLFQDPMIEPLFYARHFKRWVEDAMNQEDVMGAMHQAALNNAF